MINFFDIHAHYTDKRYAEYLRDVDFILREDFSTDVFRIINSGTNVENSKEVIEMCKRYPHMAASVGIHPTDAWFIEDCDYAISQIEELIIKERYEIAAVGEIGLDYHTPELTNKPKQQYIFDCMLSLSEKYSLPAVIHCRDAMGDCLDIVRKHPKAFGAFHCFAGSAETALELIGMGWYISVCGNITFKKSEKLCNVVQTVGAEHLLTETDSPYMAPAPIRGTLNHSSNIRPASEKMAELLGMQHREFNRITVENAMRLFQAPKFYSENAKKGIYK
jgi:TatD DNase family protein